MSHTMDMIEVQHGDRSAILGSYLDFSMSSKTPRDKRTPRSIFSGWSSSSSESSESHDGDHHALHQGRGQEQEPRTHPEPNSKAAETPYHDGDRLPPFRRQSHNLEPDPFAAEFAAAPRHHNHAMFSRSERRKLQRIETWAQDVEAQTLRRPLLIDKDQPMPTYMAFDARDRQWVFRQAYSDAGSEQSSSFNSMLARFGVRRSRSGGQREREPIGWWWPWVIVVLLVLALVAGAVYEITQQQYSDGPDLA
ncbi:hypothetical protein CLAFUW4_12253 [Fulvia fulva]|uniref:Uncharacterized protein n=1 Tax=Passalora fulva TaxID=5499 RepID=A0A9Q8USL4_PASFU|nr:uncharacterized protein CLAFUR5_11283 [Fulvia fulva]KAK4617747.1 hypothetical protein CLAFUR4_12258 [Fulvia fulva]KAK4618745.1 hypothetical protein CLAFUR0_12269 [Fulvia fulva]UJO20906.1 hypothetical protein CLAFUR5_11283 [Fulvia fulva]WPV18253.1 hypothetical protein CLAFUW4_12253 [Fulvia fulva]WPV33153.1 hypothetical protein CLAFUW7_12260 [Fulvia fulva]